jgi:hypothetical protein
MGVLDDDFDALESIKKAGRGVVLHLCTLLSQHGTKHPLFYPAQCGVVPIVDL